MSRGARTVTVHSADTTQAAQHMEPRAENTQEVNGTVAARLEHAQRSESLVRTGITDRRTTRWTGRGVCVSALCCGQRLCFCFCCALDSGVVVHVAKIATPPSIKRKDTCSPDQHGEFVRRVSI